MKDFDLATVTPKEWKEWKNSWNLNFNIRKLTNLINYELFFFK